MKTRLTLILVLWLAACTTGHATIPEPQPTSEVSGTSSPALPQPSGKITLIPSESHTTTEVVPSKIIEMVKTELSQRSLIDAEQIHVAEARTANWPDTPIDCAQPEESNAQGAVPGYKILLEAGGRYYVYRVDQTGKSVLCPELKPAEPGLR